MAKMQPFWWFKAPVIPCPTGEQITNGGFETGDFTGWDGPFTPPQEYIVSGYPHTGTYACQQRGGDGIHQNLINPVPASCLTESSMFGCWIANALIYELSLSFFFNITLHYTDDSLTLIPFEWYTIPWEQFPYTWVDLKPYVEPGKTIKGISIVRQASQEDVFVDDVTCFV